MSTENEGIHERGPAEGQQQEGHHGHAHEQFEARVTVNGKPVVLRKRKMSGVEIKQAAIDQGVAIEIGFILQEELPNGHHKIIGDEDKVEVRDHDRFTAIPNDDNS
jgi:hypothetical protein